MSNKKQFQGRRDYFGLQFVGILSLQLGRDADGKLHHSRKVKESITCMLNEKADR